MNEGDAETRRIRVSREAARLGIAVVLLLVAGLGSAVTGVALRDEKLDARGEQVRTTRFFGSRLSAAGDHGPTLRMAPADLLEAGDGFRLIEGLQPLEDAIRRVGMREQDAAPIDARRPWRVERASARRELTAASDLNALLLRARLMSSSWREAEDSLREWTDRMESTPSIVPTAGYISSGFTGSRMHPILERRRPHRGLDIVAPHGTPVVSSARGRVRFAAHSGEFGLTVEVDHGRGVVTRYAHLSRAQVRRGQSVARGDTLGRVGRSGLAVGSHLHYEVLVNGRPANPRRYIFDLNVIPD